MATPVVTDKWAGNFECHVCHRKRLTGDAFSKAALDRYRKSHETSPLKCKDCVAKSEQDERAKSSASQKPKNTITKNNNDDENKMMKCAKCQKELTQEHYNKNQWNNKGPGKAKCKPCVEASINEEAQANKNAKDSKIEAARLAVATAKQCGNAAQILQAESVLSALEAETVTGLKPIKMARGGGGGRGRRRGGGRSLGSGSGRSGMRGGRGGRK